MPFGLRSSPFQLRATITKHLKTFKNRYFDLVNQIENQLYVDDLLGGAHTVEEAAQAVRETNHIFSDAKLKMTKWTTNSPELRKILEREGLSAPTEGLLAKNLSQGNSKVLGVQWDTETDCFLFNPAEIIKAAEEIGDRPTKRNILQISSRIFDPIGFLGPIVLSLKMLFQRLWEEEIGWDQKVPDDIRGAWINIIEGLKELERLKIPRWLGTGPEEAKPAELHVFGDASKKGYGTVAYIREERDGKIETRFLCSKTVVAPPKKKGSKSAKTGVIKFSSCCPTRRIHQKRYARTTMDNNLLVRLKGRPGMDQRRQHEMADLRQKQSRQDPTTFQH